MNNCDYTEKPQRTWRTRRFTRLKFAPFYLLTGFFLEDSKIEFTEKSRGLRGLFGFYPTKICAVLSATGFFLEDSKIKSVNGLLRIAVNRIPVIPSAARNLASQTTTGVRFLPVVGMTGDTAVLSFRAQRGIFRMQAKDASPSSTALRASASGVRNDKDSSPLRGFGMTMLTNFA